MPGWALGKLVRAATVGLLGLLILAQPGVAPAAPREYEVDADASTLHVLVLRRGPLALLAHDHILVVKGIAGRITFNPQSPAQSAGQVSIPVAFIEVDDPKVRAREGLAGELNGSNRQSVRENMLGADQLDAADFPRITAVLEGVAGAPPDLRLQVRIRVREREQVLAVPVTVSESSEMFTVQGEVTLLQSAFGIAPYAALFGAIAVQDAVRVKFELIARLVQP